MSFENYLTAQISSHPSMQPQDIVKLCYQSAYGAEHLLADTVSAKKYLENEFSCVNASDTDLYEVVSDSICRIDLAAWKYRGLPLSWLLNMFTASTSVNETGSTIFCDYLKTAEAVIARNRVSFSLSQWSEYMAAYRSAGMTAVHHSEQYRQNENPHYRIVSSRFIRLLPLLEAIAHTMDSNRAYVIAIDGRAAAGKTTLAEQLAAVLDADVIHMDDFFLPPELRTEKRFRTPGGNIHYERFLEEVVPYIAKPEGFSYRVFDCGEMDYSGEKIVSGKPFRIVEGSYSCHPAFGPYADMTVFLQVEPEEQMHRILHRNGEQMAEMFRSRWIPLEEAYFDCYFIAEKANFQF